MTIYETAQFLLRQAKKNGATGSCVLVSEVDAYGILREQGNERPEITHKRKMSLEVHVGRRVAHVSGSAGSRESLTRLLLKAVEMAKASTEDPFASVAGEPLWPRDMARLSDSLDLVDRSLLPSLCELSQTAHALEDAALSQKGITRTEGVSSAALRKYEITMNSEGFTGLSERTTHVRSVEAVAGDGEHMVEGSDMDVRIHRSDLRSSLSIGTLAAERALAQVGTTSVPGGRMPVVFDKLISSSLIGALLAGITGSRVYSKSTFLKEYLGERICDPSITIIDHPHIPRMGKSRLYDADGVGARYLPIVVDGVLKTWLTSLKSSVKLAVRCTGHGGNTSGNIIVGNGIVSQRELIADIPRGLLITSLLGHGANIETGNYSYGAKGFLIENGKICRPVDEMTIAGNLLDAFGRMRVANDRDMRLSVSVPSIRVDDVTVAGKN